MDYTMYRDKLFAAALKVGCDHHTAEDIVQDTYVEAIVKGIDDFDELITLCRQLAKNARSQENTEISFVRPGYQGDEIAKLREFALNSISDTCDAEEPLKDKIAEMAIKCADKSYISFELAREFAISLSLRSISEWESAYDKGDIPPNIPKYPDFAVSYRSSWKGWKDFLGSDWLPFEAAKHFTITVLVKQGINCSIKYIDHAKKGLLPKFMPHKPDAFYKGAWQGWHDWFGKDGRSPAREILSYEPAREYVLNFLVPLGIDTLDKYVRYVDPPSCLPNLPYKYYKNRGWKGSSHFFNTEKQPVGKSKECADYNTIREWCRLNLRPHGITGKKTFFAYHRGEFPNAPAWPNNFPTNVINYFDRKGKKVGYSDLFGCKVYRKKRGFWSFEQTHAWVKNNFKHIDCFTAANWIAYMKGLLPLFDLPEIPSGVPARPDDYYAREFAGWPHFFGRETRAGEAFKRFVEQRAIHSKEKKKNERLKAIAESALKERGIEFKEKFIVLQSDRPIKGNTLRRILQKRQEYR